MPLRRILRRHRLQVIADDAWQDAEGLHFSGRLTRLHPAPAATHGRRKTLYRNVRMLLSRGVAGSVTLKVAGHRWMARAGRHGYWLTVEAGKTALPNGWHEILFDPPASSPAGLLVVDPRNEIGIISDIDDTVLVTGVSRRRSMLENSLVVAPEKRVAVPEMAGIFRRLLAENQNPSAAPVFYLSSTPRQLTDNVRRFLAAAGLPRGVLQLKKISRESADSLREHEAYKRRRVAAILAAFPRQRFHLFGDDAERDPEIYAAICADHPDRVAGVWLHRINPKARRRTFPGQRDVRDLL